MPNVIQESRYTGKRFGDMLVLNYHSKSGNYYVKIYNKDKNCIARATEHEIIHGITPLKIFKKLVGNPFISFDNGTTLLFDIKGEEFIVDTCDLEKVSRITWNVHHDYRRRENKESIYVCGGYTDTDIGVWINTTIGRYLLEIEDCDIQVDHINKNTLDNTRKNLRISTQTENMRNRTVFNSNELGIRGIRLDKRSMTYQARITVNGTQIYLGESKDIEVAKRFRLEAEKKYFGQFSPASQEIDSQQRKGEK